MPGLLSARCAWSCVLIGVVFSVLCPDRLGVPGAMSVRCTWSVVG